MTDMETSPDRLALLASAVARLDMACLYQPDWKTSPAADRKAYDYVREAAQCLHDYQLSFEAEYGVKP